MVVHPEVGKWLIALGEKAFGMDPFGWRIAAAVVGALMVLVMCRLVRRLTGSTVLGCIGRPAADASTACTSCSRGWRCSTSSWRSSSSARVALPGQRPRLAPRRLAPAASATGDRRAATVGPGARAAVPPVAARSAASASGWRSAPSGPRSTRWPRSACWSGSGAPAPAARSACAGRSRSRRSPTASRRSSQLVLVAVVVYIATWTRLAGPRRRVRGAPVVDAVHAVHR